MRPRHQRDAAVVAAMSCAAIVSAQFVGGKAVRDALFLARLDLHTLPTMVIATSVFSIGLAAMNSRMAARLSPASLVRGAFAVSTILFTVEWTLANSVPKFAAVLIYLHVSGLGPILGSGFWLVASERFDPRTAKLRFGQIAGAGTLGGLFGGLVAERVATVFGTVAVLL